MNRYEEIKDAEKHLLFKNKELYRDIIYYISTYNINEDDMYEIQMDILSIALNGQQRKESLSDIVGDDVKAFCDEIIAESKTKTTKATALDIMLNVLLGIDIYLVLSILMNALIDTNNLLNFTVGHIFFILLTYMGFKLLLSDIKKKSTKTTKSSNDYLLVGLICIALVITSGILFVQFYKMTLFKLSFTSFMIIALITITPQILNEILRRRRR